MPKKLIVNGVGELDTVLEQTAEEVAITPSGDISSTNVGAAIAELDTEKQAVSEKGVANGYAELDANNTVPISQLPAAVFGGPKFIATWNANTNTPDLSSLSPNQGDYYRVQVAGTTLLDGEDDWGVGDWAIYGGTAWDKIDNSESVTSVNGKEGVVTLDTSEIPENGDLYFTDARAQTAAVVNSTAGAETNQAPSVNAIKSFVMDTSNLGTGVVDNTEFATLNGVTSNVQTQLDAKIPSSEKAAANGVATLDGSGIIPEAQIPTSTKDVFEVADFASLPATGVAEKVYITLDDTKTYHWDGAAYQELSKNDPTQNNFAFIGKGSATWTAPGGLSTVSTASNLDDLNDFALSSFVEVGFTFTPSTSGILQTTQAIVKNAGLQNNDGTIRLRLYATTAGEPSGTMLDESTQISSSAIGGVGAQVINNFIFSGGVSLTAGTEYFMSFYNTDTGSVFTRRGNDEADSANFVENGSPPPEWSLAPQQDTIYHNVSVQANVAGSLVLSDDCFVSVPGLENAYHTVEAQTISLSNGEVAYIEVDRDASMVVNRTVTVADVTALPDSINQVIVARCDGSEVYVGMSDPLRLQNGETFQLQRVPTIIDEVVSNTDNSFATIAPPVANQWYANLNTMTIPVTPGKWRISLKCASMQILRTTSSNNAGLFIALSTSTVAGTNLLYRAMIGTAQQGFQGINIEFPETEFLTSENLYIHWRCQSGFGTYAISSAGWRNDSGLTTGAVLEARKIAD